MAKRLLYKYLWMYPTQTARTISSKNTEESIVTIQFAYRQLRIPKRTEGQRGKANKFVRNLWAWTTRKKIWLLAEIITCICTVYFIPICVRSKPYRVCHERRNCATQLVKWYSIQWRTHDQEHKSYRNRTLHNFRHLNSTFQTDHHKAHFNQLLDCASKYLSRFASGR